MNFTFLLACFLRIDTKFYRRKSLVCGIKSLTYAENGLCSQERTKYHIAISLGKKRKHKKEFDDEVSLSPPTDFIKYTDYYTAHYDTVLGSVPNFLP